MGAWPVDNISTSSVDSQADKPDRGAFLNVFRKLKEAIGARGSANGVASLDGSGRVPAAQLGRGAANGVAPLGADSKLPAANLPDGLGIPIGTIIWWPSYRGGPDTRGIYWMDCYGTWIKKADFPALWRLLQNDYLDGERPRATQFRIPRLWRRVPVGYAHGSYGESGGAESVRLTEAHMPEHHHKLAGGGYSDATLEPTGSLYMAQAETRSGERPDYNLRGRRAAPTNLRSGSAGRSTPTAVPTMPPYLVLRALIRAR